jgi:hypothetical protein
MKYSKIKFPNHGVEAGKVYQLEDGKLIESTENCYYYDLIVVGKIIDNDNFQCWTHNEAILRFDEEFTRERLENSLAMVNKRIEEDSLWRSELEKELRDLK